MTVGRKFSKFFSTGRDGSGHVMLHDRAEMDAPDFTLGITTPGHGTIVHLSPDGLRALVAAAEEALAVLDAEPVAAEAAAS